MVEPSRVRRIAGWLAGIALALAASGQAIADDAVPAGFREPRPGLYTGGVPTAKDMQALRARGVRTVIDLRTPQERVGNDSEAAAQALGLRYETLAIDGAVDLTRENAERLRQALDNADGQVLLHCASGNRVGALLALMARYEEGLSRRDALAFGRAAGLGSLEPEVDRRLRERPRR
jgi:uncharacterized protein (TIGR01244 family)